MTCKAAQELARLGRGVRRNFTPEERERRANRMRAINAVRKALADKEWNMKCAKWRQEWNADKRGEGHGKKTA
jgi:hypothetical protein